MVEGRTHTIECKIRIFKISVKTYRSHYKEAIIWTVISSENKEGKQRGESVLYGEHVLKMGR